MRFQLFCLGLLASIVRPSIIENGRPREETYPETKIAPVAAEAWTTFPPNATELSYKGRWDSKYISCRHRTEKWPGSLSRD